jgi:hypothetical protein
MVLDDQVKPLSEFQDDMGSFELLLRHDRGKCKSVVGGDR